MSEGHLVGLQNSTQDALTEKRQYARSDITRTVPLLIHGYRGVSQLAPRCSLNSIRYERKVRDRHRL